MGEKQVSGGIMDDLHRKRAIVTGGARGIGKGIVKLFLEKGIHVVIGDLDTEAGKECVSEYRDSGRIHFIQTDVSDEKSVENLVSEAVSRMGALDILINNAGIANPENPPVETLSLDEWNKVIGTNLTGYFLMAKHCIPHLRKSKGAIVNIASTRALMSEPHTEAYSASKGGIAALTHSLAISLGPDIRVNCISPGWISVSNWQKKRKRKDPGLDQADHLQHPCGRVGKPEDIAHAAAFLVSEDSAFITGENLVIDGGMTRKMIYADG